MPKTARCRFLITDVFHTSYGGRRATLVPQYDQTISNDERLVEESTPSGAIEISVANPALFEVFEVGRVVRLDITPIDEFGQELDTSII